MKKQKHYTKSICGIATFCCPDCQTKLFQVSVVSASIFLTCTLCNKESMFSLQQLSSGNLNPVFAQMQGPAVQVPATAPAAGHLSTKSVNN